MKYLGAIFIFFLCISNLLAQESSRIDDLRERVVENKRLIRLNPEEEFRIALNIEEEAKKIDAREIELLALVNQCIYYESQIDLEKLMACANTLFRKAKAYRMAYYQAVGKFYLFESYRYNKLPEIAIEHLGEGMKYVHQAEIEGHSVEVLKPNFYIAYSNYYNELEDHESELEYMKLTGGEIEKLKDGKIKQKSRHVYYANLAQIYVTLNELDSARHYSNLSKATDRGYNLVDANFLNLVVLGEAAIKTGNYSLAISFFKEAEEIEGPKNHINELKLYDNIIAFYAELQQLDSVKIYQHKKDSLRLNISENQNKMLHNLLEGFNKKMYRNLLYGIITILIIAGVLLFIVVRKNRILKAQEKVSSDYLQNNHNSAESHIRLIDLFRENSPAFTTYFNEVYPQFTAEVLKLNPKMTSSDIEFCALLKLKVSTEDISKYKFIASKTVQNKRYLIRKKLNIPKELDTYQWFENL